jgi:hypothetical protein
MISLEKIPENLRKQEMKGNTVKMLTMGTEFAHLLSREALFIPFASLKIISFIPS